MPIYALGDQVPQIDSTAYVHPDAVIIGSVTLGAQSSVWPTAVLRADYGQIIVGSQTSIQDGTIVHCTPRHPTRIGDRCTIGHNAHLEGCEILDDTLIGSGSVVLALAVVGPHAMVGAAAMVPGGTIVPRGARALGVPARIAEDVIDEGSLQRYVDIYTANARRYAAQLRRLD